jgi:outer membrane protein TolC
LEIERNKIDQTTAENQLKVLLQMSDENSIRPAITFKNPVNEKFDVNRLVKNAIERRPDFRAIELLKEQLDGQNELDHRRIWSDIGFQAGLSKQDRLNAKPGDTTRPSLSGAMSWYLGVNFALPVFDRNQGNILSTKIRKNQTLVREKFMTDTLTKDLETSIKRIEITSLNLTNYKSGQLVTSKLVRDAAFRQFGSGASTLLEFLDAVDAYHTSIQKYIETEFDLSSEFLKLKLISGQDVEP